MFKLIKLVEKAKSSREEEEIVEELTRQEDDEDELESVLFALYAEEISPVSLTRSRAERLGLRALNLISLPKTTRWGRSMGYQCLRIVLERLGSETEDGKDILLLASNTIHDHLTSKIPFLLHMALNFCAVIMTVDLAKVVLPALEYSLHAKDPSIASKACRVLRRCHQVYPPGLTVDIVDRVMKIVKSTKEPTLASKALRFVLEVIPVQDHNVKNELVQLIGATVNRFRDHNCDALYLTALRGLSTLPILPHDPTVTEIRSLILQDNSQQKILKELFHLLVQIGHDFSQEETLDYMEHIRLTSKQPSFQDKADFLVLVLALVPSGSLRQALIENEEATMMEFRHLALDKDSTVQLLAMRILIELGQDRSEFEMEILKKRRSHTLEVFWNWQKVVGSDQEINAFQKLVQVGPMIEDESSMQTVHQALDHILRSPKEFDLYLTAYLIWCDRTPTSEDIVLISANLICLHRAHCSAPMVETWSLRMEKHIEKLNALSIRCGLAHFIAFLSVLAIHPTPFDLPKTADRDLIDIWDHWQILVKDREYFEELLGPKRVVGLEDLSEILTMD